MKQRGFIHVYAQIVLLTLAGAVYVSAGAIVLQIIVLGVAVF